MNAKASNRTIERIQKVGGVWDPAAKTYQGVAVSAHFWGNHTLRFFSEAKLTKCPDQKLVVHSTVEGTGNGFSAIVCDENAPGSANVCKNGGIVTTALCADLAQHCKKAGPNDWTGSLGASGDLVCE